MYATLWAALPPIIAIVLALITKEVYSSLFIGILVGAFMFAAGDPVGALNHVINDGLVASLADSWNVGILIFLVILGMMVALVNKSGGASAFGEWAVQRVKTKVGVQLCTIVLGILIFVDDYFNCLTVGSIMSPVAQKAGLSKAKLAYLIDATAAPICIIAPISSWAAAVASNVEDGNGFALFIQAIPFNFYALLTIIMMFVLVGMKFDYAKMAEYTERLGKSLADKDDAIKGSKGFREDLEAINKGSVTGKKGHVIDLVLPIVFLIVACIIGLIYTGGFFEGESFVDAFANCDASVGLVIGSLVTVVFTLIYYLCRRVVTFKSAMLCAPQGFKAMVPPILILTFAWTLKAMTDSLGLKVYVEEVTRNLSGEFVAMLPAIIFLIGCVLAFATGTSWGTFGILIPIVVAVFANKDPQLMIIAISACMAGAVCGDHCSPISDTTIMASAGAKCNHVVHVATQLPYAITVAIISFATYIVAGFTKSAVISLPVGILILVVTLIVIKQLTKNKRARLAGMEALNEDEIVDDE